jgi:hypothetical protein
MIRGDSSWKHIAATGSKKRMPCFEDTRDSTPILWLVSVVGSNVYLVYLVSELYWPGLLSTNRDSMTMEGESTAWSVLA